MAKRSAAASMSEDIVALPVAIHTGLNNYYSQMSTEQVRVSDLVMAYGGDKSRLVRDLAGISSEGKLPAKGTEERKAYDTQRRNFDRWLKAESGKEGQKRKPSAAAQEKLKDLMKKQRPPSGAVIDMQGYIYYDYDIRWRHITVNMSGSQVAQMVQHIQAGNTHAAYGEIFAAYGAAHLEMGDDSPLIDISFN